MNLKITFVSVMAAMLMLGCNDSASSAAPAKALKAAPLVPETSLGLRKTDLYKENTTVATQTFYTKAAPGESIKFERAYDNAPPMIPHSVEGLFPIEKDNNQCLGCHMPDVAQYMDPMPTPIPKTHFVSWRPKVESDGQNFSTEADVMANKTVSHDLNGELYQGRFNCSQCHAPQSEGNLAVENTFRPDFQDDKMKTSSSLLDTLNKGVN